MRQKTNFQYLPNKIIAFLMAIVLLCFCFSTKTDKTNAAVTECHAIDFVGNATLRTRLDKAFAAYTPGVAFFTKNGSECSCHGKGICASNGDDCNCLRYAKIDGKTIDLLAVQCMGYARYIEYMLFGYHDGLNTGKFYKLTGATNMTADTCKAWFDANRAYLHVGTHIRLGTGTGFHSISLMKVDYAAGIVYFVECNYSGATNGYCRVNELRAYSFTKFASVFGSIAYAYVYKTYWSDYPETPVYLYYDFDLEDVSVEKKTASCGSSVALKTCDYEKEGYTFAGWKIGENTYEAGTLLHIDSNVLTGSTLEITAVAVWQAISEETEEEGESESEPEPSPEAESEESAPE